jgi:hypothetical protein
MNRRAISRRSFLGTAAATPAVFAVPRPPRAKLRLATVGCGGMGGADLSKISGHPEIQVVALCDVDAKTLEKTAQRFPGVKTFRDYRKLFAEAAADFDVVNVGTPDHVHAAASMLALQKGKHVYCQKPLTHDVYEARRLAEVARERKLVTQMGIQVHSSREYRLAVRIVQDGAIGKVKEVHSWSNKKWGHDGARPEGSDPVPANLDWDLWLATAPDRPFKKGLYHPGNWRKWTDFGCGTMGDMAIHIVDPVAGALALTAPKTIVSESDRPPAESFATKNKVKYVFPGTAYSVDPLPVTWYDGDAMPDPAGWPVKQLPDQGSMFVGEKGFMLLPHVAAPRLHPEADFKGFKMPDVGGIDHWHQWVDACLGRGQASANFDYAGPLTEWVLLGVIANRVPGRTLTWHPKELRLEGSDAAQALIRRRYRAGWEVEGL